MKPLASIRTSKGCPYRCRFCALWKLTGGRYLRRRPECVVEEVQDRLITDDYDFFDFIHTVLPTALSLEDFYSEYSRLYARSLSPKRKRSLLGKFRLRDLPPAVVRGLRFQSRLRGAYRDYDPRPTRPTPTGPGSPSAGDPW